MFTVIYRWRVRPSMDATFQRAWRSRTQKMLTVRGSFGSRLHREDSGVYCAVAIWPTRSAWEATEPPLPNDDFDATAFRESIEESLPPLTMEVFDDLWKPPSMIDHMSIQVSDLARSAKFYDAVLGALGYERIWTTKEAAGYGVQGHDEPFAIRQESGEAVSSSGGSHFAFGASARDCVEHFHAAAIAQGAADDGAPGLCPEYGENYFASFVRDPDGYRIEACFHG